ncbi:phosphoenolpyruvate carboxykinase [Streptococcus bovimastitidis]|uniref:phosphoenolpyruvate carboxykinase (ATP) n=1 Tax=Streptococcus bovimastitidis TaxID=1856638 RepID=A0A1L8MLN3_9STRE|nr:phosphoenolpyruvate carboxykinase (ATP) [Streptococcus bovimastitidis]OJF71663.1 phosphoenolpyruvate carboxykinase [Streptococcus bovimastitidis]
MATLNRFEKETIRQDNPQFSMLKTLIETAFYGNNVQAIDNLDQAYQLASSAPNTIILDQIITKAQELGLAEDTRVLVANGGAVVGRTAKARRLWGQDSEEDKKIAAILREELYQSSFLPFISGKAVVGLDQQFMMQANIMMPKSESNNMYSWLLNFQILNNDYLKLLQSSQRYEENDIYIYFNPDWSHEDYPDGLAYFDKDHNVAAILGLNYFGEIKKATLTLAWASAARNDYVACHGGLKEFKTNKETYVASFFGLSGSGKSTLTHAKHDCKYPIQVLHDDAFIISNKDGSSVALEPAYFDKTSDYPAGHPEQDYFLTVQNCGVTLDSDGHKVLVTEDIRNGNGRTVKSRFSTPDRVDCVHDPISAIYWIMKDDSLPPLVKVTDPVMASALGCTLMTKRSNAENSAGDLGTLVIEPYANPFRIYPLQEDFEKFYQLFASGVDCYIINTGDYLNQNIGKETTLSCIEVVIDQTAHFQDFDKLPGFSYLDIEDFVVDENNTDYLTLLAERMRFRLSYLEKLAEDNKDNAIISESVKKFQDIVRILN